MSSARGLPARGAYPWHPLVAHEDRLTGLHANTQIPKVIGFERIAQLSGETSYHEAARFFWETVTQRRSIALGGNSVAEHFNPVDDFATARYRIPADAIKQVQEGPLTVRFQAQPGARTARICEVRLVKAE